jgi:hypothetical protein
MLPHHPAASQQHHHHLHPSNHPAQNSVASFPVGMGTRGPASGALSDLLGLENELTSIQVNRVEILHRM